MTLLKLLALLMIVSTMLGAGLELDRKALAATLAQYGLFARAFVANFVLVPLAAVLTVVSLHVDKGAAIGIVLMSMAPGVPFLANSAGRKAGGSLSFAITIAICFAALSVVTIPITIALISYALPSAPVPSVPSLKFLTTLVTFQLAPIALGALVAPRLGEATAAKIVKLLHFVFLGAALVLVVLIFPRIVDSVSKVYGFGHLTIIAALGLFSFAIGWLFGGPNPEYRRTLSVATLMRNIGLCALIGTDEAFSGTLVLPTIFTYLVITFALSIPARIVYTRSKSASPAAKT